MDVVEAVETVVGVVEAVETVVDVVEAAVPKVAVHVHLFLAFYGACCFQLWVPTESVPDFVEWV